MNPVFRRSLLLAALASQIVFAQQLPDQATALSNIKAEIEKNRSQFYVPGVALAIVKDDKIIFADGFGYRDLAAKKRVTGDTLFAIGSTSKAFTSMLIGMGVDEGKIKFSDSPKKYLPYFRMYDPETDKKMTVGDLLSHNSGLPRTDLIMIAGSAGMSAEDLVWNVSRAKPTAKLGEKFQYQNIMYVAAGEVLRAAFGSPWQDLVDQRIFTPLGMARTNTSVEAALKDGDHALGYDGSPASRHLAMRDIGPAAPAGAINSSAKEMAEWVRFLLRDGEMGGRQLVAKSTFEEMFKPRVTVGGPMKYGYGWFLSEWNGHKVYDHGGNIDGFNAQVALMPDQKLGIVLLTNVSGSPLPNFVEDAVWKNLVGASPSTEKIAELKNPEQEVGTYHLEVAKLDFVVSVENGKLYTRPTGQPKMELLPLGDRKYKLAPPAPDKVYMTFRPMKEDPKQTEVEFEQDGMKFVMKPPKPFVSPVPVEDVMAKALDAAGGVEKLSHLKTLSYRYYCDLESQGVAVAGAVVKAAPARLAETTVFMAGGHRIGWSESALDGQKGVEKTSFSEPDFKSGTELANMLLDASISQELNWRTLFTRVAVIGEGKVEGEDAWIVEKTPKVGNKVTDWLSKSTYRLLKRSYGAGNSSISEVYKDYKEVDGIPIAMTVVRTTGAVGTGTVFLSDVKVNAKVDDSLFKVR